MVLYSDGVSEANSPDGHEFGRDGLMKMVRRLDSRSAEVLGTQLASAFGVYHVNGERLDDETIIAVRINDVCRCLIAVRRR